MKRNSFSSAFENRDGSNINAFEYTDENDMPNILDVLGNNFKMKTNGYPILNWQVENN